MKFKTTEWTITAAAAAHVVRQAGNIKMANHLDDLAEWLLLHLDQLERLPDNGPPDKRCSHCSKWIPAGRLSCPICHHGQKPRD